MIKKNKEEVKQSISSGGVGEKVLLNSPMTRGYTHHKISRHYNKRGRITSTKSLLQIFNPQKVNKVFKGPDKQKTSTFTEKDKVLKIYNDNVFKVFKGPDKQKTSTFTEEDKVLKIYTDNVFKVFKKPKQKVLDVYKDNVFKVFKGLDKQKTSTFTEKDKATFTYAKDQFKPVKEHNFHEFTEANSNVFKGPDKQKTFTSTRKGKHDNQNDKQAYFLHTKHDILGNILAQGMKKKPYEDDNRTDGEVSSSKMLVSCILWDTIAELIEYTSNIYSNRYKMTYDDDASSPSTSSLSGGTSMFSEQQLKIIDFADNIHDFAKYNVRSEACFNSQNTLKSKENIFNKISNAHKFKSVPKMYDWSFDAGYEESTFKTLFLIKNADTALGKMRHYEAYVYNKKSNDIPIGNEFAQGLKDKHNEEFQEYTKRVREEMSKIAPHLLSHLGMLDIEKRKNNVYLFDTDIKGRLGVSDRYFIELKRAFLDSNVYDVEPFPKQFDGSNSRKNEPYGKEIDTFIENGPEQFYEKIYSEKVNRGIGIYYNSKKKNVNGGLIENNVKWLVGSNGVKTLCEEIAEIYFKKKGKNSKIEENNKINALRRLMQLKRLGDHGMVQFCRLAKDIIIDNVNMRGEDILFSDDEKRIRNHKYIDELTEHIATTATTTALYNLKDPTGTKISGGVSNKVQLKVHHPPLVSGDSMCNVYSFMCESPCITASYDFRNIHELNELITNNKVDIVKSLTKELRKLFPMYFSSYEGISYQDRIEEKHPNEIIIHLIRDISIFCGELGWKIEIHPHIWSTINTKIISIDDEGKELKHLFDINSTCRPSKNQLTHILSCKPSKKIVMYLPQMNYHHVQNVPMEIEEAPFEDGGSNYKQHVEKTWKQCVENMLFIQSQKILSTSLIDNLKHFKTITDLLSEDTIDVDDSPSQYGNQDQITIFKNVMTFVRNVCIPFSIHAKNYIKLLNILTPDSKVPFGECDSKQRPKSDEATRVPTSSNSKDGKKVRGKSSTPTPTQVSPGTHAMDFKSFIITNLKNTYSIIVDKLNDFQKKLHGIAILKNTKSNQNGLKEYEKVIMNIVIEDISKLQDMIENKPWKSEKDLFKIDKVKLRQEVGDKVKIKKRYTRVPKRYPRQNTENKAKATNEPIEETQMKTKRKRQQETFATVEKPPEKPVINRREVHDVLTGMVSLSRREHLEVTKDLYTIDCTYRDAVDTLMCMKKSNDRFNETRSMITRSMITRSV